MQFAVEKSQVFFLSTFDMRDNVGRVEFLFFPTSPALETAVWEESDD